jgi:hypothetical protein
MAQNPSEEADLKLLNELLLVWDKSKQFIYNLRTITRCNVEDMAA